MHITLRAREWTEFRRRAGYQAARRVLVHFLGQPDFRVVHISIQKNHFHLLVEAASAAVLASRMRSLVIRLAKELNVKLGSRGQVFPHRYHDRQITTPAQARNALAYVLNNWRRHQQDVSRAGVSTLPLDPYATGVMFDGWQRDFDAAAPAHPPWPVSPARTALLRSEWRRHGLIDPFKTPGPRWARMSI